MSNQQPGMNPDLGLGEAAARELHGGTPLEDEVGIEAVRAARYLSDKLYTDEKTGLLNAEAFIKKTDGLIAKMKEGQDERIIDGAITVFDIDKFKQANQRFGPDVVDEEILGILGQIFAEVYKRKTDVAAHVSPDDQKALASRIQGDEFAVGVFHKVDDVDKEKRTHTAIEEANLQAERVNALLTERLVGTKFESFGFRLSYASVQVNAWSKAKDLKAQADQKMHEHKTSYKRDMSTEEQQQWLADPTTDRMLDEIAGDRMPEWTDAFRPSHTERVPEQPPTDQQPPRKPPIIS